MPQFDFRGPAVDFSPLGRLGETYDRSVRRAHDAEIAAKREQALAGFGQNGDLAALGNTLLRAGDLEGGMSALRQHAALQGSPFQRERAAAEDARQAEADAYRRRQEERQEQLDKRSEPHSVRKTVDGTDDYGNPTKREYWEHPDGSITWTDTGKTERAPTIGPQSGGAGDPNLPSPLSANAQGGVPLTATGQPEYGYAIPGTGARYPHGTVMLPKPDAVRAPVIAPPQGRAAVAAPPAVAPPADVPAVSAIQNQTLAPPAQAGPTAVAAPAQPNAAPIQRRANVDDPLEPENAPFVRKPPPNVNKKEWVTAETKRLQNLAGGEGQTTGMRDKLARSRQITPQIMAELDALNTEVKKSGSEWLPTEAKARMQTTYMNLVMQLKEMYGLGALQEGDRRAVEEILSNPAQPWWNPIGNLNQVATTNEQVKKLKEIVLKAAKAAEASLGGDPTRGVEVPTAAGPAAAGPAAEPLKTSTGVGWSLW